MRLTAPLFLLGSAFLASAAAPGAHAGGLAVCNAKHKRPANLYGSVLSDGLKPVVAASGAAAGSRAAPKPASSSAPGADAAVSASSAPAKPAQVSRATLKASFKPCGEGDRA